VGVAELRILGPLELRGPTGSAGLGGDKPRRLLGALALHASEVVTADRLVDLAWGESPPRSAHANLLTYLSSLRRALRPCAGLSIEARPPGYRLLGDAQSLDWLRFLDLADAARQAHPADPGKAGLLLREALGLWRGPVLADVADRLTPLQPRIAALEEARLSAQVLCVEADLLAGRHAEVLGELAELTGGHPLHEQLRGQHMLALYRCGRPADALAVFHQLREQLRDELGVDPGPGLGRLYEAILRADPQLDHATAPGVPEAAAPASGARPVMPPRQLPGGASAFTGRRDELGRLDEFLTGERDSVPVAVISGSPGVGKTALALRWAHRVQGRFPGGTLFADLRGYAPEGAPRTAGEVLDGFLRALGVRDIPAGEDERAAAFRTALDGKSVLIVLDNAASPAQVRPLLPGSPGCLVLVTSRSQLSGLAIREGAASVPLGPLAESEAVALLRRLLPGPRVDAEPGAAAGLARLCDGLPLALRIAAERAAIRPGLRLAELASQLSAERDRLDLLASADDEPVAVRSAFSCSYSAVCGPGARMFRLLGLHPGADVSEGAAAALAGLPMTHARRLLDGLTGVHLVEEGPPGRFRLHDLLRLQPLDATWPTILFRPDGGPILVKTAIADRTSRGRCTRTSRAEAS
jgi:DNA-binding SARP family transcriptional activator